MESKQTASLPSQAKSEPTTGRRFGLGSAAGIGLCLVVLVAAFWLGRAPNKPAQNESVTAAAQGDAVQDPHTPSEIQRAQSRNAISLPSSSGQGTPSVAVAVSGSEPTPQSRRLVTSLVHIEIREGGLTQEQVAAWKQTLQELVRQGPAGVTAIQEFLSQNREYSFGPGARDLLGFSSARKALLGALTQMGGSEAINGLTTVLQTTADPGEIALLAQDLEKLDPGQHRQEVLEAARQTLEMTSTRKLEMPDAAPLFEVLQRYGGSDVAQDLVRASGQWNYYATIALAQLPEDTGIPSLVQLAQASSTSAGLREAAEQMLAQVSDHSAEARTALLALVRENQVSPFTWQMVASALAGDQVGLLNSAFEDHQGLTQVSGLRTVATSDNQKFFAVPVNLTPDQSNQRLAFIDELLTATSDPAVTQILQRSKDSLRHRLSQPPLALTGQ